MVFLFILLLLLLFFFFYFRPSWGLFLAVFLAPFLGLTLDFSRFEWARNIPYLSNLDGPAADFVVLGLFVAAAGKMIIASLRRSVSDRSNPAVNGKATGLLRPRFHRGFAMTMMRNDGFFYFLPFFLVGVLSLFNVPYDQFSGSFKYLLRPILFFYLMWVLLPVILIDSEKILERVIKIIFWTGVLSALMGLVSLFISPSIFGFWRRAIPIEFWGLAPLAFNHNLLAEVLVATAPLGFYLFVRLSLRAKRSNPEQQWDRHAPTVVGARDDIKKIYFFGFIFITVIALLTFARAAWLALAAQAFIYFWLRSKSPKPHTLTPKPLISWLVLLALPLVIYMTLFSLSPLVRSSNATRLDLTGIAWTYFKLHPWLGNGVGTFVPLVEQTRLFTVEYGDPLDAHGIVQKLLAEQGLLGLITFSFFIGWIIHRLYRAYQLAEEKHRLLLLCLFLSVVGSLAYQLFNTSYYNQHLWLIVGVALAAVKVKGYRG